ncbi:unnamed protein product [Cunninghamella blakesleeana]
MYSGQGPSESPYRYVILDGAKNMVDFEKFERPSILHSQATFNEVYGRPWNKLMLPQLPTLNQDFALNTKRKDPGENKLFEDGTIANVIFEADEQIIQSVHADKTQKKAKVTGRLTYISYNHVEQFDNVELKIGGHSSREYAKVPYKLKITPESSPKGLFNRWELKLRPEATDPTMLREKLYSDILKSVGCLGPRGGYVRFYLNDHPAGLFLLTDDIVNKEYIRETIHDGDQRIEVGALIKADAGKGSYAADLEYHGEEPEDYDDKTYEVKGGTGEDDPMEDLIAFIKYIRDYQVDTNADEQTIFNEWDQKINIKHFMRQIAVEWLAGNWDALQYSGNNYVLYQNPATKQFISLPMDFDYTFGNGLEQDQSNLLVGQWMDFTAKRKTHSFLWEKLVDITSMQKLYLDTVNEINEKVTKPEVILPRLESLAYLIQHDAEWDKELDRLTTGKFRQWPDDDYLQSLEQGSGAQDENIGLKEWIRVKYDAVNEYSNSLNNLPADQKSQQYNQNAKLMKGIPPQEYEKMQEAEAATA